VLTEKIASLAFKTKNPPPQWGAKLMSILQTPPTNGNRRKFDALFVKNHIQDGTIYLLHDLDVDNLMILNKPAEAIGSYNAHILSRTEGCFDFRQYGRRI